MGRPRLVVDPRVKVLAFFASMIIIFSATDITVYIVFLSLPVLLFRRIEMLRKLKIMLPAIVVAFVLWSTLYGWSIFHKFSGTEPEISIGGFMALRLMSIIMVSLAFVYSITPRELVTALSSLGMPYKTSLLVGLSFRHTLTMSDEYKAIKEAQTSRGLELDRGSLLARIKNYKFVLLPLLVRSIENAEKLALAMQLRFFDLEGKRTRFFKLKMTIFDYLIIVVLISAVSLAILHYVLRVI